jgi:hypothetical protein
MSLYGRLLEADPQGRWVKNQTFRVTHVLGRPDGVYYKLFPINGPQDEVAVVPSRLIEIVLLRPIRTEACWGCAFHCGTSCKEYIAPERYANLTKNICKST